MSGQLRIGVIGAGGIGSRWANVISKHDKFKLTTVVDVNVEKAKTLADKFPSTNAFQDIKHIYPNVDAMIVATPHNLLSTLSSELLLNNINVLCEKPGATNLKDLEKVFNSLKKSKAKYMAGFNHRFHDAFVKARKAVNNKKIGEILFIRSVYGFSGREGYEKEWRHNKEISGGGELIDQGVHMIDLSINFIGEITEVKGTAASLYWNSEVDDNAFVLLKSKSGKIASIHASWTQWKPMHRFEIYGTDGYIQIDGLGRKYGGNEILTIAERSKNYIDYPIEEVIMCNSDADNSMVLALNEFYEAITQDREPVPSIKDFKQVLKVVGSIYVDNE